VYAYVKSSPLMLTDRSGLVGQSKSYPHSPKPKTKSGAQVCDDDRDWCHNHCWERARIYGGIDIFGPYRRCMRACLGPDADF
jgi:hypothetical protein